MRLVLMAVLCIAAAGNAMADERPWYVEVKGGGLFANDIDVAPNPPADFFDTDNEFGYMASITAGYRIAPHVRVGGEFFWSRHRIDEILSPVTPTGGVSDTAEGRSRALGGMFDVYVDLLEDGPIQPYVGGGIGFADVDVLMVKDIVTVAPADLRYFEGSGTVFAWHAEAGVAFEITEGISLLASYRYLDTGGVKNDVPNPDAYVPEKADFGGHMALVGLRFGL